MAVDDGDPVGADADAAALTGNFPAECEYDDQHLVPSWLNYVTRNETKRNVNALRIFIYSSKYIYMYKNEFVRIEKEFVLNLRLNLNSNSAV